ncbi:unnamed protein product [Chondrus crispus]|uniref:Uncharacterized protein n=1 Tax=Chondrus crispus TaxID=2769 RepID=R7QNJ6_CHOCR|nr:unnamed protein product [Chondrus crispus]CDF40067.1 unnamed protein product [Chondrus crispus]|eukprot:XP_005710361.1 unnamed protein product [Chondrus crispus]
MSSSSVPFLGESLSPLESLYFCDVNILKCSFVDCFVIHTQIVL